MISERFLSLFKAFLDNYKYYGTPRIYHYRKEQNFSQIMTNLSDILDIATENQVVFDDVNIIEHLNKTILLAAESNPYLLQCWAKFYGNYHKEDKNNNSPEYVTIQVGSEGAHSGQIARELQLALTHSKEAADQMEKNHAAEIALLNKQIESLQDKNAILTAHNKQLEEQLFEKGVLESVHQQLADAQKEFLSLAKTMEKLHEMTKLKPKNENTILLTDTVETSKPSTENAPEIKTKNTTNTNDNASSMLTNLHTPKTATRGIAKDLKSRSSLFQKERKEPSQPKVAIVHEKEAKSFDMGAQLQVELMKKLNAIRNATNPQEIKVPESTTPDSWENEKEKLDLTNSQ